MKKLIIALVALLSMLSANNALAWGGFGHGAIAYVAEQHLTPEAKQKCRHYLKHTLPYYASWMDHWRPVSKFRKTAAWHAFTATDSGAINWESNGDGKAIGLVDRIYKSMKDGKYRDMSDSMIVLNLKLLIHTLPDMHCPVHVNFPKEAFPDYRYPLYKNGRKVSFHSFWDSSPQYMRRDWTLERYAKKVDNISPKKVKKIIKNGNLTAWGNDAIKNAHRAYVITPRDTDIAYLTEEQKAEVLALADEMAIKAAYRLAYVLNEIFKY